ncbi:hypothetical protein BGZ96_006792 [Linnemannia gamsii]|uniref:Uncharacterized protein n=1 Tax=Linnemannia gamsii TaxID=64522 RepID=A0ABQ7K1U1_9FUNG|nr:hypothetical protein BGZ96_006792 [Linnemannia gamsii]
MTSTAFTPSLPYAELNKKNPIPSRPKLHLNLPANTASYKHDFDDMMSDSTTPPLDLASDSDDDLSVAMRSPDPSPSTFQPVSILLHRKRKDSQEEHVSALNLFDRQRGQHDSEYAALPALQGYGKGARGRRPTVTFDLDDEPSQHTGPLSVHPPHNGHDDINGHEAIDSVDSILRNEDEATQSSKVPDGLLAAEHALRRVSITPTAEVSITSTTQGPDSIHEEADVFSPMTSTTITNTITATTITEEPETTSVVENSAPQVGPQAAPQAAPQEIVINHITVEDAPQDLLVALFDRSSELEALAAKHSDFFNLIYSSLSKSSREPFKSLLFTPRPSLGDRDWMQAIEQHLSALPPCILEKFKGIVGWIGPEGDEDDERWGEDEYGYRDSSFEHVQIKWLRDVPNFPLETFQQCYPQFFVNARDRLQGRRMSYGGDQRDQYVIFCETLKLNRDDLPCDNAWARRMNGCLEKHPELLLQLKEIVAYETGYDD